MSELFKDPCSSRQKQTIIGADGMRITAHKCSNSKCEQFGEFVTDTICGPCPLKNLKVSGPPKVVIKIEPTTAPPGTVKVESDDVVMKRLGMTTEHHKLWPQCPKRMRYTIRKPCGRTNYVRKCENPDSPSFGLEVNSKTCSNCNLVTQIGDPNNGQVFEFSNTGQIVRRNT